MTCPRGDTAENFSSNFSSSVGGVLKREISYLQAAMQCSVNINTDKKFHFYMSLFFVFAKGAKP